MPPHLEDDPFSTDVDPVDVASLHAFHRVQNFPFKLSTYAVSLSLKKIDSGPMFVCLLLVGIDCELQVVTIDLSLLNFCKSFFSSFVRQELEEHPLHSLLVISFIMFHGPSHNLFEVQERFGLCFPVAKFLACVRCIGSLEKECYLSVSLLTLVLVLFFNDVFLSEVLFYKVADIFIIDLDCFCETILAVNQVFCPLFVGIVAPSFHASLLLKEVKPVEHLVPNLLHSLAPGGVVAHCIVDLPHLSEVKGVNQVVSASLVLRVLLAPLVESEVTIEGLSQKSISHPFNHEGYVILLVASVFADALPPHESALASPQE